MKKENQNRVFSLTALLGLAMVGAALAMPTVITAPDTIDVDTVWDSDTNDDGEIDQIYYLDQAVFVGDFSDNPTSRPTLTITPGTVIAASGSTGGTDGLDVGSLVVSQNGMINAAGTPEDPIIFTSSEEAEFLFNVEIDGNGINTTQPDPIGGDDDGSDGGEWGGVIILGNAPINFFNTPTNNLNSNSIEGFAVNAAGTDILYGGDDPSDNSGVFQYVSIRFGGFEFAEDEEINGLTMGGVGAGTTIDHVEVVANTDDGFEWFGGTVNTSHLFALYCQDESFDIDEGHQGTHQFWFALQSNGSDFGTEADGGNSTGSGVRTGEPLTLARVFNATYVGATGEVDESADDAIGGSSDSFRLKDNYAGQFHNGIFTSSGDDIIRIDDESTISQVGGNLLFTNNLFGTPDDQATNSEAGTDSGNAEAMVLGQAGNVTNADIQFSSVTRNSVGEVTEIDPRPLLGSAAWTDELTAGAPAPTTYRGAFGLENWVAGWTYASENGIITDAGLVTPQTITVITPNDTIDADTVWDSDTDDDGRVDQIYLLDQAVFVGDFNDPAITRPTLTIEPGTIIAATGSTDGTDGLDVGSLVIAQTGMINAEGTETAPIIFTSVQEAEFLFNVDIDGGGINTIQPDPIGGDDDGTDGGQWGGVIILGNAPINYFNTPENNLNSNSIEGFATNAAGTDILYGGDVFNDNSGIFRYVSIRFGGFEFATDEEINGLTMGGVGSGTTIDHVEVVANTDDGFEWFGGTVNTSHLFALYCLDESFDIDEGHQGNHQFWFALQSNGSDFGTEADGGNSTGTGVRTGEPLSNTTIFNATYVGATGDVDESGENPNTGSSSMFRLKDNFAGQFHNGIFTSSGDDLVRIDDESTSSQVGDNLLFTYNIFGTPDDRATNNDAGTFNGDAEAALLSQEGNVQDTDPLLSLAEQNDVGEVIKIDPRPQITNGPAWGTELRGGAPEEVAFRGAFGTDLWVSTWTYASAEGIICPSFLTIETPDATIIEMVEGDELQIRSTDVDGTTLTISFFAEPGANYQLTSTTDLSGDFLFIVGQTILDASSTETFSLEILPSQPKAFYRIVRVEPVVELPVGVASN